MLCPSCSSDFIAQKDCPFCDGDGYTEMEIDDLLTSEVCECLNCEGSGKDDGEYE